MYIPDITERFPEGFGGIDMTPKYFNEPVDYSTAYQPNHEEREEEDLFGYDTKYETIFKIGQTYEKVGFYGGVTIYTVKEIDRENNKILLAENWIDVDGKGTRPQKWHKLEKVDGKERCLELTSEKFGDAWIYAYTTECNE